MSIIPALPPLLKKTQEASSCPSARPLIGEVLLDSSTLHAIVDSYPLAEAYGTWVSSLGTTPLLGALRETLHENRYPPDQLTLP